MAAFFCWIGQRASYDRPGHFATLFGAVMARLGAAPAVVVFVVRTLFGASPADLRADAANVLNELRTSAHESGRQPAGFGAVVVQADTLRQRPHIVFLQA